ncbi:hypothetical protein RQN30_03815 [Arcanobacterium hippocoleae]
MIGADDERKGIKIIDFSEVPSDVLPIVTGIISRLLFDVQIWMDEEKELLSLFCVMKLICIFQYKRMLIVFKNKHWEILKGLQKKVESMESL